MKVALGWGYLALIGIVALILLALCDDAHAQRAATGPVPPGAGPPVAGYCSWMWDPINQRYMVVTSEGRTVIEPDALKALNLTIDQFSYEWIGYRTQAPIKCEER